MLMDREGSNALCLIRSSSNYPLYGAKATNLKGHIAGLADLEYSMTQDMQNDGRQLVQGERSVEASNIHIRSSETP